jgi:hypothetical protein
MAARYLLRSGLLALVLVTSAPALASATYSGTVNGYFSDAVLSGSYIAVDGSSLFQDNGLTADFGYTTLSPSNDTITWGHSTTGAVPQFSFLNFQGASFVEQAPDTLFKLGTITFQNGTSDLDSLIFGARLTLDLGSGIDLKTTNISIVTTLNTQISQVRDADFIGFSDFPQTFNVFEGAFSIVDIFGQIVGDPMVTLNHIAVTEGFESTGYIGTGVGGVPEPSNWAMLIAGFGLVGAVSRRRRVLAA